MKDKLIDRKELWVGFGGKIVKTIEDAGSIFDDYSVSLKIRQILLH